MARNYTKNRLKKDIKFIEFEAKRQDPRLQAESDVMAVRIRIPYDPNDHPEAVLRAVFNGSYDILRAGDQR